jgi:hypothetical protein
MRDAAAGYTKYARRNRAAVAGTKLQLAVAFMLEVGTFHVAVCVHFVIALSVVRSDVWFHVALHYITVALH